MYRPGANADGQAWADRWIERMGATYQLNDARIELGRDLQGPPLPAPFVRMDPARMSTPAYAHAQQALAQGRDAELAQTDLPGPRRKILESLREHGTGLTLFVDQPEIPMDNNGAERAARGPAVGRKNYYGSGSVWSGELMVMAMTLFLSLTLHGVEDRKYLIAYLEAGALIQGQPPRDLTPWLPWNYKKSAPVPATPATARGP